MEHRGEREARRLEIAIERLISEAANWREADLYVRASEGEWTAMEVLAHTIEMQPYWAHQIQRVLAQPGGPFGRTHDDTDRTGFVEAHARDRLSDAIAGLQRARDKAALRLRSLSEDDWSKVGIHPRRGEMSVSDISESFLVGHAEEHVEQAIKAVRAASGAK